MTQVWVDGNILAVSKPCFVEESPYDSTELSGALVEAIDASTSIMIQWLGISKVAFQVAF